MTGRRGVRRKTTAAVRASSGFDGDQITLFSKDQYKSKNKGLPPHIFANVDVHGIIFVVLLLAFVVWPAAQWALDL